MIVGAYVDRAAPEAAAGAEWALQDTMRWLAGRGHDCRVMSRTGARRADVGGVKVYSHPSEEEVTQHWQACDVMLTQMDAIPEATVLSFTYQTPLAVLIHSENQLENYGVQPAVTPLVVFNADHVHEKGDWWPGRSITLHPVVDEERVRTSPEGRCATLINVSHEKGGWVLWRLAEALEEVPFMGVRGAYGEQVMGPEGMDGSRENPTPTGLPPNLRIFHPTETIGPSAYAFTRVLLMLSASETYGRVGAEAMVSGIPVIAVATPGVREACGNAAQYVEHRDQIPKLARLIRAAYDQEDWEVWSEAALARAEWNGDRQARELRVLESELLKVLATQVEMRL